VIRAVEVHRYLAVIVENVVEVVDQWELFDWWVDGMRQLATRSSTSRCPRRTSVARTTSTPRSGATACIWLIWTLQCSCGQGHKPAVGGHTVGQETHLQELPSALSTSRW